MLKRPAIQVLRRAAHTWNEVAALSGVSEQTARRIGEESRITGEESPITNVDDVASARGASVESRGLSTGPGASVDR